MVLKTMKQYPARPIMTRRSIAAMVLWSILTCGIYLLFWFHDTKRQMNQRGADIPTMWWILVPFVNIWWYWRYSKGIPVVTRKDDHDVLGFLLILFTGIGPFVIQWLFNRIDDGLPELPRAIARDSR
jgi:hypothetical protein